jgi:RHS repeat-associated protein
VAYTYDALGRRLTMDVPGQAQIAYGWDNADRLQTITQGSNVVDFDYDNANRRTKLTYPSGTSTEYAYDTASRLTGLTYTHGGNTLGALTYAYDAASQRVQVGGSWARTGLPAALSGATYNAANHQTAVGGQALTYDLNGNLTGDGTNTYTWNARNQLASISGSLPASFVYDAFGRRQRTTLDGAITDVVYDGLNPVRQAVGATTVNLLTGLGIDEYLTRADSSGSRDLLSDALGSTVSLSDSGTLQTEYSYEPFGAVAASGSSSSNEFRYTGREDDGTGLYYYRARYYHPALQRFISEDPIGFAAGDVNLYAYVANAPLDFSDPSGMSLADAAIPGYCQDPTYISPTPELSGRKGVVAQIVAAELSFLGLVRDVLACERWRPSRASALPCVAHQRKPAARARRGGDGTLRSTVDRPSDRRAGSGKSQSRDRNPGNRSWIVRGTGTRWRSCVLPAGSRRHDRDPRKVDKTQSS